MALPWLESLPVWGAGIRAATPPKRFVVQFMGTGISPDNWGASGQGEGRVFKKSLTPLEPLKTKVNVISGLYNRPSTGVGIHPGMTGNILSGMPLTRGAVLHGGISVDQVLAAKIGQETIQPSLVLACEKPLTGYHESNFSMAYSSRGRRDPSRQGQSRRSSQTRRILPLGARGREAGAENAWRDAQGGRQCQGTQQTNGGDETPR